MAEATDLHTAEQMQQKEDAINNAVRELAVDYMHGNLTSIPELLYNRIDNLHALLTELRRG